MAFWLMKSEPSVYGIDDLQRDGQTSWGGVRNYQVRNMFRDDFAVGDEAFFYHSSCVEPGIVGTMVVTSNAFPDSAQFDRKSEYFDARSSRESPTWLAVDVRHKRRFASPILLETLRGRGELAELLILRRGNRLSVIPVTPAEWRCVLSMAAPGQERLQTRSPRSNRPGRA